MEEAIRQTLSRMLRPFAFKPWRLLGFGYYQAWVYIAVFSTVLFVGPGIFNEHMAFTRQYFSLSLSLCLVALAFVSYRLDILKQRHYLLVIGALFTVGGTALIALPSVSMLPPLACIVVGISCTSLGNSLLIICWGALWCSIDTDRMAMHILVSNCFAGILYLVVTALPPALAIAATAVLPVASTATLLNCTREPARRDEPLPGLSKGLLAKAVAVIVIIPLVYGVARAFSSASALGNFNEVHHAIVGGITCLAFAVMVVSCAAPHERIIMRLYRLIIPLMIVGFVAYALVGAELRWLALAAIACGFYSFEGVVWLLHPTIVLKTQASKLVVFGWGRALFHLCGFVGASLGFFLVERHMAEGAALGAVCLAVVIVLLVVMVYVFTEHDLRLFIGRPVPTAAEDLDARCQRLADRHRLSKRERDVLVLLAKGRSVPFIAEEFTVSKGTVKTHVRHVYEKLGIHSKQELLNMVEESAER